MSRLAASLWIFFRKVYLVGLQPRETQLEVIDLAPLLHKATGARRVCDFETEQTLNMRFKDTFCEGEYSRSKYGVLKETVLIKVQNASEIRICCIDKTVRELHIGSVSYKPQHLSPEQVSIVEKLCERIRFLKDRSNYRLLDLHALQQ